VIQVSILDAAARTYTPVDLKDQPEEKENVKEKPEE
jgi:hypothetical protein